MDTDGEPGVDLNVDRDVDATFDSDVDREIDADVHRDVDAEISDGELEDEVVEFNIEPISDPVGTARRRHGAAGAMLAAGMFGIDIALGRKPKEEVPIVMAASSEPVDIDKDGIEVPIDENTSVYAPPQPPSDPFPRRRRPKA